MTTLPPNTPWTQRADLAELIAALGPENARYVGGAVRDTLLGIAVKDIDIATPLLPEDVIARLKAAGIRSVPTGIDHGTITAVLAGGPVEVTTLRHDVSTDGRRATVVFAKDWQDDAARRDFTINALYAVPATGEIFDWFGGLKDLTARRVRFIGDARQRILEDHLRILRYFRFQARFGSQPADSASENSCAELAETLRNLSRERVGMEMLNLLSLPNPAPTVARMEELGVLSVVLPEAKVPELAALVTEELRQDIAPDALRRLAALLPADSGVAAEVADRFRLSNAETKRLICAATREFLPDTGRGTTAGGGGAHADMPTAEGSHPAEGASPPPSGRSPSPTRGGINARALAYRLGMHQALDRLLLTGASTAPLKGWQVPTFPLKGGQIIAHGIKPGPEVTRILRAVEDRWVAEGFPNVSRVQQILELTLA